jgi:hypothetical protein
MLPLMVVRFVAPLNILYPASVPLFPLLVMAL